MEHPSQQGFIEEEEEEEKDDNNDREVEEDNKNKEDNDIKEEEEAQRAKKRPEGPHTRSWGPEGPWTSSIIYMCWAQSKRSWKLKVSNANLSLVFEALFIQPQLIVNANVKFGHLALNWLQRWFLEQISDLFCSFRTIKCFDKPLTA